jgi:hypothetical protein
MWLASALGQIERAAERTPNYPADANPATAHMFIVNPLHGGISGLFATPPPTGNASRGCARWRAMMRRLCVKDRGVEFVGFSNSSIAVMPAKAGIQLLHQATALDQVGFPLTRE